MKTESVYETQTFDSKFESLSFESLSVGSIPTFGDIRICDVNKSDDFVARLLVGVYGSPAVDGLDVKVSEWRGLLTNR